MKPHVRYGLIGCGGFGRFCLSEYRRMPNVRCVAVADADPDLARRTADEHGIESCASPEELLRRGDIDLVHLATPPFTHADLALRALDSGKHVLCEKPLALTLSDAERMVNLARQNDRILAVNLIMRYNPLCQAVKSLVADRLLGDPLFASLTNAAQDEVLGPTHWFWDPAKSGGIFIEHGVHFFDLFEWWFGPGELLAAQQMHRPGTGIVDQVHCAVRYGEGTLGTFYHGFHQMLRRDRQDWRIIFELGVLTMSEWVPTRLELDMSLAETDSQAVGELFPHSEIRVLERYSGDTRHASSRHRQREIDVHAALSANAGLPKMELYGRMLRDLLNDQIAAIADPSHPRLVSESNGVSSLAQATAAQAAAVARKA